MSKYFLDTSVIINFLRGKQEALDLISNLKGENSSSYSVLSELYEGIYRVGNSKEVERKILKLFESFSDIYSLDWETAREFGKIRFELKSKGEIIEDMDIIVAAICISHNLQLVTQNTKHFSKIRNLQIFTPLIN